ncbi:MAG: response regulator transcription factor [Candidatus Omnitrophica bacterium]|nr:response regulator transcription factor [Candidatus Omnitrophota bacterium]MCB9721955.1 response regulator transcription factor [Candidatus Omnitrophota bacterium]
MRILLVEDDQQTAAFILQGLKTAGYQVVHAKDGEEGLHYASSESFELAVVDIMLPVIDGLSMIDRLRRQQVKLPVIILSAKSSLEDRVAGLQKGGDDYLVKPFAFTELLARIQAMLRRSSRSEDAGILTVGDLNLDPLKRKVTRQGDEIFLPTGEFLLLEYLMRNSGRVVSKTMIIENVWDFSFEPGTNVIEARVSRLRSKIDRPYAKKLLHTVRGFGYVIEDKD